MILESNDFKNNEFMDKKFTCDGEDFSPHLRWSDPPEGTRSYALSLIRPDRSVGEIGHWYIYNIPLNINEIEQDGKILGIEVQNDFNTLDYEGPNASEGVHQYIFRIYAINIEKLNGLNNQNFKRIIRSHTIEFAELIGLYERKTPPKPTDSCSGCNTYNPF
jgi:Raf kinase inhibitor-like YbhB/YbcL family protein